ncbi:MAG: hypothetical protein NTX43_14280 [Bacteroidetes bacterium]|nr:hypothetical protein [Bacteroidota bacterium]
MLKGKHTVIEIAGVRCTVVETGASDERIAFIKEILEFNGYEVKTEKEKAKDGTLLATSVIGVTDILFNAMINLYERKLLRKDGHILNPSYWNQWPEKDWDVPYYQVQR